MGPERSKEHRVVQATRELLDTALEMKAEHVYFMPQKDGSYRSIIIAAGDEIPAQVVSASDGRAIVSRLKLIAGMDITVQNRIQEGRMLFPQNETGKEWFILCKPTPMGEQLIISVTEELNGTGKRLLESRSSSFCDAGIENARFAFRAELFELKMKAEQALSENGIRLLQSYSSMDLNHSEFGLEVCGIVDENTAIRISRILSNTFPEWKYVARFKKEYGPEAGWKVKIQQTADQ